MMSDEKKVGLLGASLGTGNRGVSALCASVVKLAKQAVPGIEPFLLVSSRNGQSSNVIANGEPTKVPVVRYRLSPASGWRHQIYCILIFALIYRCVPVQSVRRRIRGSFPWVDAVADARLVGEIRGGDSFSDIYGLKRFIAGSLPVISVILIRGEVALLPQTYGPFKSPFARALARYVLRNASIIMSRDHDGMRTVRNMIGENARCHYCPDVAFSLEAIRPKSLCIEPPLPNEKSDILVGINVNGLMFNGGYSGANMFGLRMDYAAFLAELVTTLVTAKGARVLLVPHTFAPSGDPESDPHACRRVMSLLSSHVLQSVHVVAAEYDQHEIKGVIGLCDFFVGSRMHACIAAMSQGIATVGVAYSKKFQGVFESVGMQDWVVDGRVVTNAEAIEQVLQLLQKRHTMTNSLKQKVNDIKTTHKEVFREMLAA